MPSFALVFLVCHVAILERFLGHLEPLILLPTRYWKNRYCSQFLCRRLNWTVGLSTKTQPTSESERRMRCRRNEKAFLVPRKREVFIHAWKNLPIREIWKGNFGLSGFSGFLQYCTFADETKRDSNHAKEAGLLNCHFFTDFTLLQSGSKEGKFRVKNRIVIARTGRGSHLNFRKEPNMFFVESRISITEGASTRVKMYITRTWKEHRNC